MLDCWQDLVEYIQTDIESSRQTTGNGRCNGNGNGNGNGSGTVSGSGSICGVSIALRRHFAISLFNHYLSPTAPQPVQLSPRVRDALMKELKMSAGTGSGLGGGGFDGGGGLGVDQSEPDVDAHVGPPFSPNAFLPVFEHCLKYLMKPWLEYLKTDIASFLE